MEFRKTHGFSQELLSKKIGIKRTTLSNIEAGRQQVSLHLLYKITEELGADVNHFLPSFSEVQVAMNRENEELHKLLDEKNIIETATRDIILQALGKNTSCGI